MEQGEQMATYGYVRVSTAEQGGDDRTSLDTQRRRIEGLASAIGLTLDAVFTEPGVSGSRPLRERPEGARLWATLRPGDRIIAAKLDRLFRSAADALATAEELKGRYIELYLLDMGTEPVTGAGAARLFFGMLALVAEFERTRIVERITEGKRAKRQRGGHTGGKRPFGYQVQGEGRAATLEPDPDEQAAIARILTARAAGKSLRAIKAELAQAGHSISHQTVRRVLARQPAACSPAPTPPAP